MKSSSIPTELLRALDREFTFATASYNPFHSAHEGYAVLLEEIRELEHEVFLNHRIRDVDAMKKEALQVAAMAMRFIVDITG